MTSVNSARFCAIAFGSRSGMIHPNSNKALKLSLLHTSNNHCEDLLDVGTIFSRCFSKVASHSSCQLNAFLMGNLPFSSGQITFIANKDNGIGEPHLSDEVVGIAHADKGRSRTDAVHKQKALSILYATIV